MNIASNQPSFAGSLGANPVFLRVASTHMSILSARIDDVISRAVDRLSDLASESDSDPERSSLFDAAIVVNRHRQDLKNLFLGGAGRPLRDYSRLGPRSAFDREDGQHMRAQDMRILDDRDVAETLACEDMVTRSSNRYRQDIHALRVRFAALAQRDEIAEEANPVAPQFLCEAYRAALDSIDIVLEARLELYRLFDIIVLRQLAELYDPLNEILARAGIVPNLRWEPRLDRARARKEAAQPEEDQQDKAGAEREEEERAARRNYLDGWLYGSIQWLLSRHRKMAGDTRDEQTPGVEAEALSRVLAMMQRQVAGNPEAAVRSTEQIKQILLEQVARRRMSKHGQFTLVDENVLDSVGMMFDFVGGDTQLPLPFQATLSKLQIPYLKAALHHRELLADAKAPPKLLLNELATAGLGWSPDGDPKKRLLNKVEEVVDQIIHRYDDDPAIFERLLDDFKAFAQREERRAQVLAKRESEAMAGRERLQLARRDVGKFLVAQTENRQLPPLVGELLRKSWAHVMVLTLLKHGRESQQWRQAVATARELVWSVSFEPKPDAVRRLRTRLPVLAKALASGLKKVGYSDADIRNMLFSMKKLYTDLIRETGSDRIIIEASAEGLVIRGDDILEYAQDEEESERDLAGQEEVSEIIDSVQTWKTGQWVVFHRDDGEPVRAKLSWISPITGRYLFVNQRGLRTAEKSLHELAEDMVGERVSLLDDEELVTRAMSAVADQLQQGMAKAA